MNELDLCEIEDLKLRGQGDFSKPSTLWVVAFKDKVAIDIMEEAEERCFNASTYLDKKACRALRDKLTEILEYDDRFLWVSLAK